MAPSPRLPAIPSDLRRAAPIVRTAAQAAAFWTGVLLPLAHVPMIVLLDHGRSVDVSVVAGLVTANVIACVLGHGHHPSN